MANQTLELTPALYDYILKVGVRESPLLQELRHVTASMSGAQMQISPEQGQLMGFLTRLMNAKKVLEIGVFTGYSSLVVAIAMPAAGQMIACDVSKDSTQVAEQFWQKAGVREKIDLRIAPATETLEQLLVEGQANSFDFAFIDADKQNYPTYYEKTLQLLRPGGLMLLDNVLQGGRVAESENKDPNVVAIRQLNEKICQDSRVELSLIPISDGLTLLIKR